MSGLPVLQQEYKDYLKGKARTSSLPKDNEGNVAAYGLTSRGQVIYGPAHFDQFFPTWDCVGKEYRESSFKTRHGWKPMIGKHMKFLEDRGFTFVKKLGKGGYGEVWRVRATKLREGTNAKGEVINVPIDIACKIIDLKSFEGFTILSAVNNLIKEAELHKTLRHTNIVNEEEVVYIEDKKSGFPQPIKVCIFMELCDGDLLSLIESNPSGKLSEKETQQWFRDIVFGLKYLHDIDLAHLDIKPKNILYKLQSDGSKVFKLADFGLTYYVQSGPLIYGKCGTTGYRAPEMGAAGAQPKVCDIFSLGVTLSVSLTGAGRMHAILVRTNPITQQLITNLSQQYRISKQVLRLLEGMFAFTAVRLTIEQVIQHDWFLALLP